ncbi:MAG: hypothetical protein V4858_19050 [Pseudomonadota bacterium]
MGADNTPSAPLASPIAAPLTLPLEQRGIVPASGAAAVRVATPQAGGKTYTLKAHVVPGAALNATQKVAAASAALAEILKQAREQQDNATEQMLSLMQKNVTVANGATLSLASPKSSWGSAVLSVIGVGGVDLENGSILMVPTPGTLEAKGFPGASCKFVTPEDGYYMVTASIEAFNSSSKQLTLRVSLDPTLIGYGSGPVTAVHLNGGANTVVAVEKFTKGHQARAVVSGDSAFNFRSCEISRLK